MVQKTITTQICDFWIRFDMLHIQNIMKCLRGIINRRSGSRTCCSISLGFEHLLATTPTMWPREMTAGAIIWKSDVFHTLKYLNRSPTRFGSRSWKKNYKQWLNSICADFSIKNRKRIRTDFQRSTNCNRKEMLATMTPKIVQWTHKTKRN